MKVPTRWGALALALTAGAVAAAPAAAAPHNAPLIQMRPNSAPNVFGAPSWTSWKGNVTTALTRGRTQVGSYGPGRFIQKSHFSYGEVLVTGFPSWKGHVDPGARYGSAFANEEGNRLDFAWIVKARKGHTVNIANGVTYNMEDDDSVGLAYGGAFTRTSYDADRAIGIDFGSDNKRGGGDDHVYISGTHPVDEIIGFSPGNAFAAYCPDTGPCGLTEQKASIDDALAYDRSVGPFHITGTVEYGGKTVRRTVTVG